MRIRVVSGPLAVQAITGTHVVLLGMNLEADVAGSLLGFAVHRVDHTEGQAYWLPNQLLFKANDKGRSSDWRSLVNPLQTFRWGDYTAKPDHTYTYRIVAMGGTAKALVPLAEVSLSVFTSSIDSGPHGITFNRGAIASQWYATRFKNKQPNLVPRREAYRWLSRGLEEALLAFIGQADGPQWSLRCALYQATYPPVLEALRIAADTGADVQIVVDSVGGPAHDPRAANDPALTAAGLDPLIARRTHIKIAHNKFIVASHRGRPVSVWTGSTNITEGGLFGQSNVGHVVRDEKVAASYLQYWQAVYADPLPAAMKAINEKVKIPPGRLRRGVTTVFSPRGDLAALEWYAFLAAKARNGVFLTAAFGVGEELMAVFKQDKPFLRYVLMDTDRGGAQLTIRDADPDNQVTVGAPIPTGGWGQWVKEVTLDANKHVRYVHTKFMLIDPLSADPIVITGSANFSRASARDNDENMLVIRGDTDVADIYLTEFMRVFTHFEFRARTRTPRRAPAPGPESDAQPPKSRRYHLKESASEWVTPWYVAGSSRAKERRSFSGS